MDVFCDDEPSNLDATEYTQDNDETEIIHNLHHAQTQHEAEATTIENRISALNNNLKQKENLITRITGNITEEKVKKIQEVYEKNMKALSEEVKALTSEREQLILDLEEAKTKGLEVKKMTMYKTKLRALEKQLKNLRIKQTRQQKLLELKNTSDAKVSQLKTEVEVMKRHRIKLVSQKQKANERFRQFKKEQEHQLAALRKQKSHETNPIAKVADSP